MAACRAVISIDGQGYRCDQEFPHSGFAHGNADAGANWISDGEARRYGKKGQADES